MKDEATYGFSKADASALIETIGMKEEVKPVRNIIARRRGGSGSFVSEVRWVDPVLEYRIGATWYTIDTAVNCSEMSPLASGLGA